MVAKKAAPSKTITKDGLFISRKLRRDAEAAAKAEAELKQLEADDAADAADLATYQGTPEYQAKSDAEKTVDLEHAQAQATAEARKKYHLTD